MRALIALAGAIVLIGCSVSDDLDLAEKAVPKFRELLDSGRFETIYGAAADELRNATRQEDFIALLAAVHRKLGNTKQSSRQTWHVNYNASGKFVTLIYTTLYAEGDATERFTYRLRDDQALLVGYHINSSALIIK